MSQTAFETKPETNPTGRQLSSSANETKPKSAPGRLATLRKRGLIFSFAILFNRLVPQWLFRARYFTVFHMATDRKQLEPNDVSCHWCEKEHDVVAAEELTYFKRAYSSGVLKAGGASIDGELSGAFWCAREAFDENELGVRYILNEEQAWFFAAYVDKAKRGRRIMPRLLNFMTSSLAVQGITHHLAAVNPFNYPSMAVFNKHSHDQPASVLVVRVLSVALCLSFGKCTRNKTLTFDCWKNPVEIRFQK